MNPDNVRRIASRKIILALVLLLTLLVTSDSIAAEFAALAGDSDTRAEINRIRANPADLSSNLDYTHIEALERMFPTGHVSYMSEVESVVSVPRIELGVTVDLTDENYGAYAGLPVTRGVYFDADAMRFGRNVAVISETLAEKLFMSLKVIGNDIRLLDQTYTIIGLYRQNESLCALLGSDGKDRVFVPFTSHSDMMRLPIDTLFIKDPALADEKFKENMLSSALVKETGVKRGAYRILDFFGSETLVSQWNDLILFVMAAWMGVMFIKHAGYVIRLKAAELRRSLNEYYFSELIRVHPGKILIPGAFVLILAGGAAAVLLLAQPHLFVPSAYIPPDNLFDAGFYLEKIKENIFLANADRAYVPTGIEQRFHAALTINVILFLMTIPALLSLHTGLKLFASVNVTPRTRLSVMLIAYGLFLLSGMIITITGAVSLVFSLKNIVLVTLWVVMKMFWAHTCTRPTSA